jgi:hypothetical protein
MMRITRILESTRMLGFETERALLADVLTAIYADHSTAIGMRTWRFWQQHFPGENSDERTRSSSGNESDVALGGRKQINDEEEEDDDEDGGSNYDAEEADRALAALGDDGDADVETGNRSKQSTRSGRVAQSKFSASAHKKGRKSVKEKSKDVQLTLAAFLKKV